MYIPGASFDAVGHLLTALAGADAETGEKGPRALEVDARDGAEEGGHAAEHAVDVGGGILPVSEAVFFANQAVRLGLLSFRRHRLGQSSPTYTLTSEGSGLL